MRSLLLALSLVLVLPNAADARKKRKHAPKRAHALKHKAAPAVTAAPPVAREEPARPARAEPRRAMVAQADDNEVPPHASGGASR